MSPRHNSQGALQRPPPEQWHLRWKTHLLIHSFVETSTIIQTGISALHLAAIFRWILLPMGAIAGGVGVSLVEITTETLTHYLPSYALHALSIMVVLGGPDILPPMTLVNGCELLIDRLKWGGLFTFVHYSHHLPAMFRGYDADISAWKALVVLSGLWHIDRGDYNLKMFIWASQTEYRNTEMILHNVGAYHFQTASGVGMLLAGLGLHSPLSLLKAAVLYAAVISLGHCCMVGSSEEE